MVIPAASENRPRVRVSSRTPLNIADQSADKVAQFGANTRMGRPAHPEEIAPAFVFFASEADSGYCTGEVLGLLGGGTRSH